MKVLLAGAIEGHLQKFYAEAAKQQPNWIICAGDFGCFPDPARMDRGARKHAGKDFSKAYVGSLALPQIPTLFVAGVHDDNRWLQERMNANNTEVLSNVHWLAQGYRTIIGFEAPMRVTGVGRAHSELTWRGDYNRKRHRHYTRRDIEKACSSGPTDILVLYEHPDAPGLRNVIYATRPKLILTATHPNRTVHTSIQDVPVISLSRGETKLIDI